MTHVELIDKMLEYSNVSFDKVKVIERKDDEMADDVPTVQLGKMTL